MRCSLTHNISLRFAARKGLGINRGAGHPAQGVSDDVEAKEELAKEEKGKGNRAFQDKRFKDAIKHFSVCIKLDEVRGVFSLLLSFFSPRPTLTCLFARCRV